MKYSERLDSIASERGSIVCLGMDPVLERMPLQEQSPEKKIVAFYTRILEASDAVGAVKLNYAYFAQYGFPGLRALKKLIAVAKGRKVPVILDGKRGDIGASSEAYAREMFAFWKADACTVSPYMGSDSVAPFLSYAAKGKGTYVLVRTSNPGAEDFQALDCGSEKLFSVVAKRVSEWKAGAVVGATNIVELENAAKMLAGAPLLIPGVGTQGGSAADVAKLLRKLGKIGIHRISSSSSISYAHEKKGGDSADAAASEIEKLNKEIGKIE
jgi:orotidine-5'-phosphate decarboxylase